VRTLGKGGLATVCHRLKSTTGNTSTSYMYVTSESCTKIPSTEIHIFAETCWPCQARLSRPHLLVALFISQ